MSFELYKNGKKLFKRSSKEKDNYKGRHWWLKGFRPGLRSKPKDLKLKVSITLKNEKMSKLFVKALKKASVSKGLGKAKLIKRKGKTVEFNW